jgi:hypothetical protein
LELVFSCRPDFIPSLLGSAVSGASIKDSILSLVLVALTSADSVLPLEALGFWVHSSILLALCFGLL